MKRFIYNLLSITILIISLSSFAQAQAPTKLCMSTNGTNCIEITPDYPFAVYQGGNSFVNITTKTDTNVKSSSGTFVGIVINTGGTSSHASIYNDADGTCNSNLIGTVSTVSQGTIMFNVNADIGICVTTDGVVAPDITILYR